MKRKISFIAMFGFTFLFISASFAQYSKVIRNINSTYRSTDYFNSIKNRAEQLIQSAGDSDTLFIPGGTDDVFAATINSDTISGGGRRNPNRVYKLQKNTIYTQWAGINVINPTGTLTIVGEKGGTKPVIILSAINVNDPGMNYVQGSIKLDNIHMQNMITNDNKINDNLFVCSTANKLPQSVCVNNCLFEFVQLATFSCDGYTDGAKFKITNSYFRNYFNVNSWWGGGRFN